VSAQRAVRPAINKYRACKGTYRGVEYASQEEIRVAMALDALTVRTPPLVAQWEPHPKFVLLPRVPAVRATKAHSGKPGLREMIYHADFLVYCAEASPYGAGHELVVELKGYAVRDWPLRYRVFRHVYPDVDLRVIHKASEVLDLFEREAA